ncbi:MAG: DUF1800 family protein [Verrucomicrobia bacterium]|nr:DUF1800 family protein [Verrucomicrobiota bacterium]
MFTSIRPILHHALSCLIFLMIAPVDGHAQIDDNGNDASDVWEAIHGPLLAPDADDDADGFTNRQEAPAGTNPNDPTDHPRFSSLHRPDDLEVIAHWPSVPGIRYRILASRDMHNWYPVGSPVVGSGPEHNLALPLDGGFATDGAWRSRWTGLTNGGLSTVKSYAANGTPAPALELIVPQVEIPQTSPDEGHFGEWVHGWLLPPANGDYTFWIASDDGSELWISSDANPANKSLAARVPAWTSFRQWTKYPEQVSAPITLFAGHSYYFEVFQRESSGGDHLSVAWTRPDQEPGTREILGPPHLSTTGLALEHILADGDSLFFRLLADQVDSDGDGVTDYEEQLLGLDPHKATTTPRVPDADAARRTLSSASTVSLGVATARAYEAEHQVARFTLFRSGGIEPISVAYAVSGTARAGIDYAPLAGLAHLPAGARAVSVSIDPLPDQVIEPQQTVTLTLQPGQGFLLGSPASATVTIDDSADVIFVASLRAPIGVASAGSGVASIRRAGNALGSQVTLSFAGLGSPQTAAELFVSPDGAGGPVVLSLPLNQIPLVDWAFDPAGGLSREDIIAALDDHSLWLRLASTGHSSGELLGQFLRAPAWETMPESPAPPPAPTTATNPGEAARFLTQSTFGPTDDSMTALEATTYAAWIDAQQALPPTRHLPYVQHRRAELELRDGNDGWQTPRNEAWWQHALTAPDQLRQRMAFALSQIFVISQFGALDGNHEGTSLYYDTLVDHAFGNYRDLLEVITLSPMMGTYLSMMRNQKPDPTTGHEPDENYAREVMQLFSVGLNRMHADGSLMLDGQGLPLPTYTQDDIVALAHVFTGWGPHYDPATPPRWSNGNVADRNAWFRWGYDELRPMSFYDEFHDTQDRTILGGTLIPAGTNGVQRLELALDAIFLHPNLGPFLARQLIQRFVTSNPSPGYIQRVAQVFDNNGQGVRGDLGATLKALLLDYEARHPEVRYSISYGKPAEPLLRMTRMLRVLGVPPPLADSGDHRLFLNFQWSMPEQAPLLASSVFNFFQPGFSNPGPIAQAGLLSPEFQIFAETTAIRQANRHFESMSWGIWTPEPDGTGGRAVVRFDFAPLVALLNTAGLTPQAAQDRLIDHLNERLLFGTMSPELRQDIRSAFAALPTWFDYSTDRQTWRARMAAYLVMTSPEFFVQR